MSEETYKNELIVPSVDQMSKIESPQMKLVILTIKKIQQRLKDPDVKNLEFSTVYEKLSHEFNDFFEKYTSIYVKVIRGEDLATLSSIIYYKDKVLSGKMSESDVSNMLAKKYLPENLKNESDKRISEMYLDKSLSDKK